MPQERRTTFRSEGDDDKSEGDGDGEFVQLMEHHKSEGEMEFLTRAGKL
jgi:hypothetical protein